MRELSARPSGSRTVGTGTMRHRHIEVGNHPPDDRQLLRVLLAEIRHVGLNDVEQLQHHGRDAVEMAGPVSPAQVIGQSADVHRAAQRARIHLGDRRREHEVDAELPAQRRGRHRACADSASRSSARSNCSGLTKMLTTTVPHSRRARSISRAWPACSAPIVGTRPIGSVRAARRRRARESRRSCRRPSSMSGRRACPSESRGDDRRARRRICARRGRRRRTRAWPRSRRRPGARTASRTTARTVEQAEHVVADEHLAVAVRLRRRCRSSGRRRALVTVRATVGGIASSTIAKAPACFERHARPRRARRPRAGSRAASRVAAELMHRLRLQAEVAHHRNADVDQPPHDVDDRPAAFELHRRGAASCSSRPALRTASSTLT